MSARGTGFADRLGVQLPLIDAADRSHARAESLADILVNIGFNGATSPPSRLRFPSRNGHAIEQPVPSTMKLSIVGVGGNAVAQRGNE